MEKILRVAGPKKNIRSKKKNSPPAKPTGPGALKGEHSEGKPERKKSNPLLMLELRLKANNEVFIFATSQQPIEKGADQTITTAPHISKAEERVLRRIYRRVIRDHRRRITDEDARKWAVIRGARARQQGVSHLFPGGSNPSRTRTRKEDGDEVDS